MTSAKATTDPSKDSNKDDKVLIRRRHVSCSSRIVHLSCPTRSLARCQQKRNTFTDAPNSLQTCHPLPHASRLREARDQVAACGREGPFSQATRASGSRFQRRPACVATSRSLADHGCTQDGLEQNPMTFVSSLESSRETIASEALQISTLWALWGQVPPCRLEANERRVEVLKLSQGQAHEEGKKCCRA